MGIEEKVVAGIQGGNGGVTSRPSEYQGKRGLWPGHRNPGGFKVGHDPRRNLDDGPWSSKVRKSLEDACQAHTAAAIEFLTTTMADEQLPPSVRMEAAKQILDRGHGKAVDRLAIASVNEGSKPVQSMTRDELMQKLSEQYSGNLPQPLPNDAEDSIDAQYS